MGGTVIECRRFPIDTVTIGKFAPLALIECGNHRRITILCNMQRRLLCATTFPRPRTDRDELLLLLLLKPPSSFPITVLPTRSLPLQLGSETKMIDTGQGISHATATPTRIANIHPSIPILTNSDSVLMRESPDPAVYGEDGWEAVSSPPLRLILRFTGTHTPV